MVTFLIEWGDVVSIMPATHMRGVILGVFFVIII